MEQETMEKQIERVRSYLCGYQFCVDMLDLRGYERKRRRPFEEEYECTDLLAGDESIWLTRMYEIQALIERMRNGKAKLILYYHYIRGESIEFAANRIGISRRSGYRWHQKGLAAVAELFLSMQKTEADGCV